MTSSLSYTYSVEGWDSDGSNTADAGPVETDACSSSGSSGTAACTNVNSRASRADIDSAHRQSTPSRLSFPLQSTLSRLNFSSHSARTLRATPRRQSGSSAAMEDTARQHYIIGDNLRHKGFYDDSVVEFQKSLDIRTRLLGEWHLETGKTYYALGLSQRALKDFPAALLHLTKAAQCLEQEENIASDPDVDKNRKAMLVQVQCNIARTHHTQAVDLQRLGRYDASIQEHRKALRIREVHLGPSHLETARTYYCMACALSDRGDFDEAVADLRRALRVRYQIFGPDHLDTIEVIENIGTVLTAKGFDLQDVEEYKQTLPAILQTEMEGDEAQAKGLNLLDPSNDNDDNGNGNDKPIVNKQADRQFEIAMTKYKDALNMEQQLIGDLHPATCDLHLKIAECLGQLQCIEQSLQEYRAVIAIYEDMLGKFSVKVAVVYSKLGSLLLEKGEYETALSFFAKAYGIYDSTLGNHPDTIQALMNVRIAAEKERGAMDSMAILKRAERQKLEATKIGILRTQMPSPPSSPKQHSGKRSKRKSKRSSKKGKNGRDDDGDKKNGQPVEVQKPPEPVDDII